VNKKAKLNKRDTSFIYRLTLVAAVMQPLMTLPQAIQIYTTQDATGVSLWTWLGFLFFGSIFLLYGITYRLKPIIVAQSLWFAMQLSVVVGILLWG